MPDIEDDDFIRRYEGALIHYRTGYERLVDRVLREFPPLPRADPAKWQPLNPTAVGGGFQHSARLHWVYPGGIAIVVCCFTLDRHDFRSGGFVGARQIFYGILSRWRRNRY